MKIYKKCGLWSFWTINKAFKELIMESLIFIVSLKRKLLNDAKAKMRNFKINFSVRKFKIEDANSNQKRCKQQSKKMQKHGCEISK
jgi:hypothetical protein